MTGQSTIQFPVDLDVVRDSLEAGFAQEERIADANAVSVPRDLDDGERRRQLAVGIIEAMQVGGGYVRSPTGSERPIVIGVGSQQIVLDVSAVLNPQDLRQSAGDDKGRHLGASRIAHLSSQYARRVLKEWCDTPEAALERRLAEIALDLIMAAEQRCRNDLIGCVALWRPIARQQRS